MKSLGFGSALVFGARESVEIGAAESTTRVEAADTATSRRLAFATESERARSMDFGRVSCLAAVFVGAIALAVRTVVLIWEAALGR